MAKVRWIDQNIEVEVPLGTDLRSASKMVNAPQGDACGGVCACSTCHVYVEEGQNLLTEAEEDEEDILDKAFDVRMNSRLGCQAKIQREGTVSVRVSKESLAAFYNEHPDERPKK